jgi:aldehyde dehydrogenase (NAD+)
VSDPLLEHLGIASIPSGAVSGGSWGGSGGQPLEVRSPIDGRVLATLPTAEQADVERTINSAAEAFIAWRTVPAPLRGELVRRLGEEFRRQRVELAQLITLEVGKIPQESLGEVQECIDVCDFAVGLSRQLHGLTIASERPGHRMMEQWHPLGAVGVITAFNFPMAVWAWNAAIALVCGDSVVWKPSEKAPLCALACHRLLLTAQSGMAALPGGVAGVVIGRAAVGEALSASPALPLVSATGSVRMGAAVAVAVAARFGRSLLELGGNNAMVVSASADLDLALRAIVFSAVGTAGQRCTSLRRLIVQRPIREVLIARLREIYGRLRVGDPRQEGILVGPLIDHAAGAAMDHALAQAVSQGGVVHGGGRLLSGVPAGGVYVRPALVEIEARAQIVQQETFAPILYLSSYDTIEEAIALNNGVPQGLSSAIFTGDLREAEQFLAPNGSDCGIANVNIGTSGAEIGGAFGGEKQTGGGRESGSDAWRSYMRRTTNTINYSRNLPLAQGIDFHL